jgi:hypothetical protein
MPEVHLFQWVAAFAGALWLTARWLLTRPTSRWRHLAVGLVATLLWLPVAYTAGNVHVADGGTTVGFGSDALGTVAIVLLVVCIAGLVLGLYLWVEEAADDASAELPASMRTGRGPREGD